MGIFGPSVRRPHQGQAARPRGDLKEAFQTIRQGRVTDRIAEEAREMAEREKDPRIAEQHRRRADDIQERGRQAGR